jgi:hypothetical protein
MPLASAIPKSGPRRVPRDGEPGIASGSLVFPGDGRIIIRRLRILRRLLARFRDRSTGEASALEGGVCHHDLIDLFDINGANVNRLTSSVVRLVGLATLCLAPLVA